jgi:iron complex transport system ATP-binding protein
MNLKVNNLNYHIGDKTILNNIYLDIRDGEFVGLIGPNGCGKSTLLKHIYRTYKPERNRIFINEKDVLDFSFKSMAQEVAVMSQENNVEFDLKVFDMVMFGRYSHKKFLEGDSSRDKKLCADCLRTVGMEGYENRSYLSLSGGEKQRVLLA